MFFFLAFFFSFCNAGSAVQSYPFQSPMPVPLGTPQFTRPLPQIRGVGPDLEDDDVDVDTFMDRLFPNMVQHAKLSDVLRRYKSGLREKGIRTLTDLFQESEER